MVLPGEASMMQNSRDTHSHMSKTSTAAFATNAVIGSKHTLALNASAPDPSEFFEAPSEEIDKFDRKFSKTALR